MMNSVWEKLLIAFISAIFGIVAAILTPRYLDWLKRRRLKDDLIVELENLKVQINLQHLGLARSLQMLAHGNIETSVAQDITNPIYVNFYKDVVANLNAGQRQSFEMIHSLVAAFNRIQAKRFDLAFEFMQKPSSENLNLARKIATGQYENVRVLDWHIGYHLRHQTNPELGFKTEEHREYLILLEQINRDMANIINAAKKLDPDGFLKIYNPDDFPKLNNDETPANTD